MKRLLCSLLLLSFATTPVVLRADSVADVVKAQAVLAKVIQIMAKYQQYDLDVPAPTPRSNTTGKYVLPYTEAGALTEWATKSLNVQLGAAAGEQAGAVAGKAVASKVPFGGLASGFMKKKGKEIGAVTALGGDKYIRETSSLSFDNINDYAVYMQVAHGKESGFQQALAAAMAIYPELEAKYDSAINQAYRQALKTRGK